jgi:hypothetical protein
LTSSSTKLDLTLGGGRRAVRGRSNLAAPLDSEAPFSPPPPHPHGETNARRTVRTRRGAVVVTRQTNPNGNRNENETHTILLVVIIRCSRSHSHRSSHRLTRNRGDRGILASGCGRDGCWYRGRRRRGGGRSRGRDRNRHRCRCRYGRLDRGWGRLGCCRGGSRGGWLFIALHSVQNVGEGGTARGGGSRQILQQLIGDVGIRASHDFGNVGMIRQCGHVQSSSDSINHFFQKTGFGLGILFRPPHHPASDHT